MTTGQRAGWVTWLLTEPSASRGNPPLPQAPDRLVRRVDRQTPVVYVIRTRRVPFFRSRPSLPMLLVPTGAALAGAILPYTGLPRLLGFTPLPWSSSSC